MTGIASFARAMSLHRVHPATQGRDDDVVVFAGDLSPHWTIGPKIHGGVMLSLCAKAAQLAVRTDTEVDDAGAAPTDAKDGAAQPQPIAVSASYLWAPDPGPVELVTRVLKRGRTVSLVDVELRQGTRVAVRVAVTLGAPEQDAEPLLSVNPVLAQMSPEPPPELESIGPGHPMAEINHLAAGCDIRPDMSQLWAPAPGQPPVARIWVRPRCEVPDVLFALTCGDISMPVTFAVGRTGWAPTVQLTAYLRSVPSDGWLRVLCSTTQVGQDWFDEDHTVVDSAGRIVVQTRQLALVPAP